MVTLVVSIQWPPGTACHGFQSLTKSSVDDIRRVGKLAIPGVNKVHNERISIGRPDTGGGRPRRECEADDVSFELAVELLRVGGAPAVGLVAPERTDDRDRIGRYVGVREEIETASDEDVGCEDIRVRVGDRRVGRTVCPRVVVS